jgi:hypothetical protein
MFEFSKYKTVKLPTLWARSFTGIIFFALSYRFRNYEGQKEKDN